MKILKIGRKEIITAVIILFVLLPLIVMLSGVSEFTQNYETDIDMDHQIRFGSIKVYYERKDRKRRGKYTKYKTVHIGVDERGIFVKTLWILSLTQPALLFPWEFIDSCKNSYGDTTLKMNKTNSTVILSDEDGILFKGCIEKNKALK